MLVNKTSQPTSGDVHVNTTLRNVMIDWALSNPVYAFNRVFPMLNVERKSNKYFVRNREDTQRNDATPRAGGTAAPRGVRRLSTQEYMCERVSYAEIIDDETAANSDTPTSLYESAARAVGDKIMLALETKFVAQALTTGIWKGATTGTDLVGGADFAKFAAPSTGNPVSQALRPQISHLGKIGIRPSEMKLVLGPEILSVFLDHDEFLNRLSDSDIKVLSEQRIATILGLGEVVIPSLGYNPNAEVEPAGSGSPNANEYVMGDDMLLLYTPKAPSLTLPSAGYSFAWSGLSGAANGMRTKRYRDEPLESWVVEGDGNIAPTICSPELGIFFSDCL